MQLDPHLATESDPHSGKALINTAAASEALPFSYILIICRDKPILLFF